MTTFVTRSAECKDGSMATEPHSSEAIAARETLRQASAALNRLLEMMVADPESVTPEELKAAMNAVAAAGSAYTLQYLADLMDPPSESG